MDNQNPMNPYMMNGGMMGPQWQIQEVLDSNGKVTGRTLVPASPGMMGQNQSNPIVEIVLKKRSGKRDNVDATKYELKQANNGPVYVHDRQFQDEFRPCGPTRHVTPVIPGAI